jgi:hypothetical protein
MAAISSNSDAIALANQAFSAWNGSGANLNVTQGPSLSTDVTACNADQFIDFSTTFNPDGSDPRMCGCIVPKPANCTATTCINPVIFDANGDITAALMGEANRTSTLAFAGPIPWPPGNPTGYAGFNAVINGVCLEDNAAAHPSCGSTTWTTALLLSVMTHEFGHALGMDHTQVNPQLIQVNGVGDAQIIPPNDVNVVVPTMYPFLVTGAGGAIPNLNVLKADDKAGIFHLYPKTVSPAPCKLTGGVFNNGSSPSTPSVIRCAEVVIRPTTAGHDPNAEALSAISGAEVANSGVTSSSPTSQCTETNVNNCGNYVIDGLQPGVTYSIGVQKVNKFFTGGSRYGPCDPPFEDFKTLAPSGTIACPAGGGAALTSSPNTQLCPTGSGGSGSCP